MTAPLTDDALLRRFVGTGCDDAFAQLVSRHAEMVYAAALRQTRRADLAEDVTQAAFILLARKAGKLRDGVVLGAWLHKVARYGALNALRAESRRRRHEQKAADMAAEQERQLQAAAARLGVRASPGSVRPEWGDGMELLDAGIAHLSTKDREAIVLRFLERQSLADVGKALGVSEDAAQMRVARAVEKLRAYYRRRGFTLTPATLGAAVGVAMPIAAPAKFATHIANNALHAVRDASLVGGSLAQASQLAAATARSMTIARAVALAKVGAGLGAAASVVILCGMLWQSPALPTKYLSHLPFTTPDPVERADAIEHGRR